MILSVCYHISTDESLRKRLARVSRYRQVSISCFTDDPNDIDVIKEPPFVNAPEAEVMSNEELARAEDLLAYR